MQSSVYFYLLSLPILGNSQKWQNHPPIPEKLTFQVYGALKGKTHCMDVTADKHYDNNFRKSFVKL